MSKNNESRVIRALTGLFVLLTALREIPGRFDRSPPPPTPSTPASHTGNRRPRRRYRRHSTLRQRTWSLMRRNVRAERIIALGLTIAVFWLEQRLMHGPRSGRTSGSCASP